jgi:hypothetical protein
MVWTAGVDEMGVIIIQNGEAHIRQDLLEKRRIE